MDNTAIDRANEYQAKGIVGSGDAVIETAEGIEIKRGVGAGNVTCQYCGKLFWPRTRSGGKPQKFCSTECRRAADAERKANAEPAAQRDDQREENPAPDTPEISDASAPEPEPLATWDGGIPRQLEITIKSIKSQSALGNDVEIAQEGNYGWDECDKIVVASQNVLKLCRQILWAHGWKEIHFIRDRDELPVTPYGSVVVQDGDEPGEHY